MTLIFLALVLAPSLVHAASREDLKKVESELSAQKEAAAALDAKAHAASASLDTLRQKLIAATAALQAKEAEQDRLEDKLDELSQDIDGKQKDLKDKQKKLSVMTDALIEISREPPETKFLQSGLTADHIHRAILLRSVLPRIREQASAVAGDLGALHELQAKMAEQKHLAIVAQENLQGQQRDLDQLIAARQGMLQKTEAQRASIAHQLETLAEEAKDLHQLLDKVSPQPKIQKSGAFSGLAPALKPPVAGSVARGYGARDSDGVLSEGITYAALAGSPVVAPRAGKVVFAGPFRGYGKIVILQHDGGYHSFLAGFGRIDADMGQEVAAGEPLGILPQKDAGKGARPELYFEVSRINEPIDPTGGISQSKSQ